MKEAEAALLCDMNFPIVISKLAFRNSEHSYSFYFTIHTTLFSLGAALVAVNFDLNYMCIHHINAIYAVVHTLGF